MENEKDRYAPLRYYRDVLLAGTAAGLTGSLAIYSAVEGSGERAAVLGSMSGISSALMLVALAERVLERMGYRKKPWDK